MRSTARLWLLLLAVGCGTGVVSRDAGPDATVPAPEHVLGANANFAYPVGPAGGSLSGTYPNPTVSMGGAVGGTAGASTVFGASSLPAAPGSGTTVLTDTTGTLSWSAPSVSGITQLTGDGTAGPGSGSQVLTVTQAQTGALTFGSQGQVTCAAADTTCKWSQASTASASAANSTWAPQVSTNTNGTPGNAIVALGAPTGSGQQPLFEGTYSGVSNPGFALGTTVSEGTSRGHLWLGTNAAYTFANYVIVSDGSSFTYFNAPSTMGFVSGGANFIAYYDAADHFMFGSSATSLAQEYFDVFNAATKLHFGLGASTSAGVVYDTPTTDVATNTLTVQAQNAYASASTNLVGGTLVLESGAGATTNGTPGNVLALVPVATGTGTVGYFGAEFVGDTYPRVSLGDTSSAGRGTVFVGSGTAASSATNYAITGDGSTFTYFNGISSLGLLLNGGTFMEYAPNTNGIQFFGSTATFGGGTGVLGITNASVMPTVVPSATNGVAIAGSTDGVHWYEAGAQFTDYVNVPLNPSTANSQIAQYYYTQSCYARTTSSSAVSCGSSYAIVSGHAAQVQARCTARAVTNCASGCALGDWYSYDYETSFSNVAGTVTQAGTPSSRTTGAASMSTTSATYTVSSNNLELKVAGPSSTNTTDWSCVMTWIAD